MKMRNGTRWSFILTLTVFTMLFCSPLQALSAGKVYNLKYVVGQVSTHPMSASDLEWIRLIEERTNGRVKVDLFAGTLGKVTDFYDMVKNGMADIVHMGSGWAGGRFPLSEVVDLPFEVSDRITGQKVLTMLYDKGMLKELDPFKVLMIHATNGGTFFLRDKKITKLDELEGLKIRPVPGVSTKLVESWKAVPVGVRTPDLYMAMEKGTIDGMFSGSDNVAATKVYETCKYQLTIPTFRGAWYLLMNKKTWDKLPSDIQKTIDEVSAEALTFYNQNMDKLLIESNRVVNQHLESYSLDAEEEALWRKAADSVTGEWIKEMESKNLPGREAVEIMRSVVKAK